MSISRSRNLTLPPKSFAARTSFFSRAFSSRSDAIVSSGFRDRLGAPRGRQASDAGTAARSRATSLRRDMIVLRLLDSTPASERSFSRRVTSACKARAFFAVRRTSLISSAAAFSLFRLASSCDFSEPAREREANSARRSSSQRASAAAARARSCSYRGCQSRRACAGAASAGDQVPSPPSTSVRAAPESSRIAMRSTVAHGRNRYQRKCGCRPFDPPAAERLQPLVTVRRLGDFTD